MIMEAIDHDRGAGTLSYTAATQAWLISVQTVRIWSQVGAGIDWSQLRTVSIQFRRLVL